VAFAAKLYHWSFDLRSPPEALWPLVSDTDRFNRDCGFPPFKIRPPEPGRPAEAGVRRLRATYLGLAGEWDEREFDWIEPVHFGVDRRFTMGPLLRMELSCTLGRTSGGGSHLRYEVRVTPRNVIGAAIVPAAVGFRMRRDVARVIRSYDQAQASGSAGAPARQRRASPPARIDLISKRLVSEARQAPALVERLAGFVATADDASASKMRPYALADRWGFERRETLDLFLHATRAGMLDLSWEVLCPHCRGSRQGRSQLAMVGGEDHCDSCNIDFKVNFDQSVELMFVPNPAVRRVARVDYCIGGPQITPHIVAQKQLDAGGELKVSLAFPEGRYRLRAQGCELMPAFRIERGGAAAVRMEVGADAVPIDEPALEPGSQMTITNVGPEGRRVAVERVAWSDQSVTAAAVTSRQVFRDLFSREILRPGEKISVGSITIVFTDLKNSTSLYRQIGDAPAFGRVLTHFETVRAAVAARGGAVIKTMGDAVMASFSRPSDALQAMRQAQSDLASSSGDSHKFALKCSIHHGPCLAINQNERLDYFGTTVNIGARLCSVSTGTDIVVSDEVLRDPEVAALVGSWGISTRRDSASLRGVGNEQFGFWRVTG
jgi:class 3 adenylate cyclase